MNSMFVRIKRNKVFFAAFVIVMAVGIFLRTYNFHDWLHFGDDQIRDAYLSSEVAAGEAPWPIVGPFMSFSGAGDHSEENSFHMGPIYYYFQIISAKVFGESPDKFAYPDVLFSILSLPLLFLLLKIYFDKNLSLAITAIYAVSEYFISYSRFAWNTNPIPFFVLLFLLSLYKFLEKNEKVSWGWTASLGVALGVGFQLHAITMIIFSAVTFCLFVFSMKKNFGAWKKWALVFCLFLVLNASQIVSEARTNFSNTKTFLNIAFPSSSAQKNISASSVSFSKLKNDLDCHIEANFFFLTSSGNEQCSYEFITAPPEGFAAHYFKNVTGLLEFLATLASLFFSIAGYFLLFYYSKRQPDDARKYFLRFVALYFVFGFLIMFPLSKIGINDLRYFVFGFFMPFMFLGFIAKFVFEKFKKTGVAILVAATVFCLLIFSNVRAINNEVKFFLANNVTCSSLYKTTLGEVQPLAQYMISHSAGQKQIYLFKDSSHRVLPDSLGYSLQEKGVELVKLENGKYPPQGSSSFFVSCKEPRALPKNTVLKTNNEDFDQRIGHIYVYQLKNSDSD